VDEPLEKSATGYRNGTVSMRIGIDASRLAVGKRTGTENYAYQVTRRLLDTANGNHHFTLYFNQPPTSLQLHGLKQDTNMRVRAMPFPRMWTHARLSLEMLLKPPDVLFVPAHVLPLVHPRKSVVTVHDLGYLHHPETHTGFARQYLDWSTPFSAKAASRVITVSEETKASLIHHYNIEPDKVRVIYHGFDREHFHPVHDLVELNRVREKYNIGSNPYLFYVGTIQPRKNLVRLIEAFSNVVHDSNFDYPERSHLQLVLGGKAGWLSEQVLEQTRKAGLGRQLNLAGYVADNDLPALMSGAEGLVLPSLYEGFGLPVLEALACGTPVVCSNAGSLPEVAGEAALFHHPMDTKAIEWNLRRLLTSPNLREELREKGFIQAAKFSWEKCAAQTLAVIEETFREG
jgi:glycosyltransferase involved in cell wall biosynthesis